MKKFPIIILLCIATMALLASCLNDVKTKVDTSWRDANLAYYTQQSNLKNTDGTNFYQTIIAPWDNNAQVLMHWFNDRDLTKDNLKPLYTSTVDLKYKLTLYDGTALDSSFRRTSPADSIFRTKLNMGVITGWSIAVTQMHVGDSCRVVIPYTQGYGMSDYQQVKAYSTLVFDIKLVDIPAYEGKKSQ